MVKYLPISSVFFDGEWISSFSLSFDSILSANFPTFAIRPLLCFPFSIPVFKPFTKFSPASFDLIPFIFFSTSFEMSSADFPALFFPSSRPSLYSFVVFCPDFLAFFSDFLSSFSAFVTICFAPSTISCVTPGVPFLTASFKSLYFFFMSLTCCLRMRSFPCSAVTKLFVIFRTALFIFFVSPEIIAAESPS